MRVKLRGLFVDTKEKKSRVPKEGDKSHISKKERHPDKAENKARATAGKARSRKAGHEAVSDQKSHEYH
jgi:hypothetical protein